MTAEEQFLLAKEKGAFTVAMAIKLKSILSKR